MMSRSVAVLALLVGVMASTTTAASAHTELLQSNPADGSTLSSAPAVITLTFNEPILSQGASLVAKSADGTAVNLGATSVTDSVVSAPWLQAEGDGFYTVAWRAVADDGHPVTGTLTFTIAAGSASSTSAPTPTSATPTEAPAVATGINGMPAVIGAVVVVALVGTAIAFAMRRRSTS